MKIIFKKIKSEKEKKNFDRIEQLETELVKFRYANNPDKLQHALEELNKIHVVNKKLHEIRKEKLQDYTGEFEMVGKLSVGDENRETHIRFRKIMKLILRLLMKDMMQKMLFSKVIIIKSILHNLI